MSLRGIGKAFGSQVALRGVDLDLFGGECLGLVGDNGAGKSTLSKIMSGAYLPDAGRILLSGAEVRLAGPAEARAQRVEMVYQDLSLCDTIDVAGNLFLGREITRRGLLDEDAMRAQARAMLDRLGIRIPRLSATVAGLTPPSPRRARRGWRRTPCPSRAAGS